VGVEFHGKEVWQSRRMTTSCKYDEGVATYKIMLLIQNRRTVHVWPEIEQSV